ncbi:MAG: UDP-N-acetylmuramoylalanine--D-glutamate ligase, partial [Candidatus Raymondbacteria bacterium RifOxyC12_full_50_8]
MRDVRVPIEFKNKKVTVLGLARSGVAAALVLKQEGARVFGSDAKSPDPVVVKPLEQLNIDFETNGHSERVFDADLVVLSPGIPLQSPVVLDLKKRGVDIISEIELAYQLTEADIVAITGSNGKSTTTALAGEIFKRAPFRSRVGGNIGDALCGQVAGLGKGDVLIAEVSSFQLDTIKEFRPRAAAILNLTPDHLDRYPSADAYYLSKIGITKNQTMDDLIVLNNDDPESRRIRPNIRGNVTQALFSSKEKPVFGACVDNGYVAYCGTNGMVRIVRQDEIALPGPHNLMNVLAVVPLAMRYAIPVEAIAETLRQFKGIEHRIEFVAEKKGVRFYNDSKATNIDSVRWALLSMKGRVHLIAGGRDKNSDYTLLSGMVKERVATACLIGEAAEKIRAAWKEHVPVRMEKSMESAVAAAYAQAKPGENVLLSPACASFDMYRNYEERGRHFKSIVGAL